MKVKSATVFIDPARAVAGEVWNEYARQRLNPQPFRSLNGVEIDAILAWEHRKAIPRLADLCLSIEHINADFYVSYRRHRGNFTVCSLVSIYEHPRRSLSAELRTGASRRHDKDRPNQLAGELAALQRAICAKPITILNHAPGGFWLAS